MDDASPEMSKRMKSSRGGFWSRTMSLDRVRDHPFLAALLLSILIRVLYRVVVYFSPLIVSTMLCVLAFIRLGPLLQQSREESSSKVQHEELEKLVQHQQQQHRWPQQDEDGHHPWWKQLDGLNFVMATLRELYCLALEHAKDTEVVKEISDKFEAIVVALQEFSSCLRTLVTDQAPPILRNLPDKRRIVAKACLVGDMLGMDLNLPIRTLGTFIDEVVSEDPVNYVQEMVGEPVAVPPSPSPPSPSSPLRPPPPPPPPPPPSWSRRSVSTSAAAEPEEPAGAAEEHRASVGAWASVAEIQDEAGTAAEIQNETEGSSDGTCSDKDEQEEDPYVRLFAQSGEIYEIAEDDNEGIDPSYYSDPAVASPLTVRHAVTMVHLRRKHFLSDLLLIPSLLRASRRCFMACFRHRMPRRRITRW